MTLNREYPKDSHNPEEFSDKSTVGDELHRRPLARTTADLIFNPPSIKCLRIGIYGRWGEGKTTLLKFAQEALGEKQYPVAWCNPSNSQNLIELWSNIYLAINDSLQNNRQSKPKSQCPFRG